MSRELTAEIATCIGTGEMTAREVATAIHARMSDVLHVLRRNARFSGPFPREDGRLGYRVRVEPLPAPTALGTRSRGTRTHKQRVLDVLSDGRPHSHHELYGLHVIAHSRIAELRADGHEILSWVGRGKDGPLHVYQLVGGAA